MAAPFTITTTPSTDVAEIVAGGSIGVWQALVSPSGQYRMVVQSDGNVGVYGPAGAIWQSSTAGSQATVSVGTDGELTFSASQRGWAVGSAGTGDGHRLLLQDDGNLALYSVGGVPIWSSMWGLTGSSRSALTAPRSIGTWQSIVSPNGAYRLVVQSDGNVGVYGPSGAVWQSTTAGSNPSVTVAGDGELSFVAAARSLVIGTGGTGVGNRLVMQNDGNLALYSAGGIHLWSTVWGRTGNSGNTVYAPGVVREGQALISGNGRFRMVVQTDGNVGVYGPNGAIWQSSTAGSNGQVVLGSDGSLTFGASTRSLTPGTSGTGAGHHLVMQDDGNLALYSVGGVAIWSSMWGVSGNTRSSLVAPAVLYPWQYLVTDSGSFRLVLQGDGNMGLYSPSGKALWASGTVGSPASGGPTWDGDFRVTAGGATFSAGTAGSGWGNRLVLQDDGNLGLYTTSGRAVWASNTARVFDPGRIISDEEFYNAGTMTVGQIDAFIRQKGSACVASSSGVPCLKDYRETTWTRTSTICGGTYYGAADESAATILYRVGQVCGVNPQVLLVTLQKEQSLVTASGSVLTPRRYQIAMGFGCPDTAPCDAQYYGFYNQVLSAAQQFRRYRAYPTSYGYRAGFTNTIAYSPTAGCGSSPVYIVNQATAGLYNYTPYQPNAAMLNGTPNSCSSSGNLNFWKFYTSWFR